MYVNFNILNQLGSPSINSNTFANRPAAGQTGRLFVSTDTFEIYRDNGTGWDLIGGPGSSTITGSGTATQVAYFTGTNAIGSSANLFWDNTNGRLGVNTATPGAPIDVHVGTGVAAQLNSTGGSANTYLAFQTLGTTQYRIGYNNNASADYRRFSIYDSPGLKEVISIDQQSRYVGINYQYTSLLDQPQYTLDVSGSGRFTDTGIFATNAGTSVSIGIAPNPAYKLYVSGAIRGTGVGNAATLTLEDTQVGGATVQLNPQYGTGLPILQSVGSFPLLFGTNNTEVARFDTSGNLGILNSTPSTSLGGAKGIAINGGATPDVQFRLQSNTTGTTSGDGALLSLASDSSMYLYNYENAAINFGTNNTIRSVITGGGNFLIGTTTDAGQKLQVNGSTAIQGTTKISNGGLDTWFGLGASYDNYFTSAGVQVWRNAVSTFMTLNASGQLGIGTTSPTQGKLVVQGDANSNTVFFKANSTTSQSYGVHLAAGTNSTDYAFRVTNQAENAEYLMVRGNGNVGINTTSPTQLLDVRAASSSDGFAIFSGGSGLTKGGIYLGNVGTQFGSLWFDNANNNVVLSQNYVNGNLTLGTNSTERMRITSGGNVLIGTTSDAGQKLQVNGTGYFGSDVFTYNNGGIFFSGAGSYASGIFQNANGLNLQTSSTPRLTITTGGQVGINTTNPTAALEVNGGIKTSAPSGGTAAAWKFGSRVAATVVLSTTQYIELDVNGTLYKLAVVT